MSHLIYNGQFIGANGKFLSYLPPPGIVGLAIWNGFIDSVNFSTYPDILGNKKATFYITINSNMPEPPEGKPANVFNFGNNVSSTDMFQVGVYRSGSNFYIMSQTHTANVGKKTDNISSLLDQEIFVEIIKSAGVVTSISINDNSRTLTTYNDYAYNAAGKLIGPQLFAFSPPVDNIIFRDIKIYDDPAGTNTLTHWWAGYPAGNTNTAWLDLVGAINGSVAGTPGVTT